MRIAVDVDGVIANRIGSIVARINDEYDLSLTYGDVDRYDFSIPGSDVDIHDVIERSRRDREHLLGLNPIDDAIGGVSRLYDRYTVVIATHRPERIHDETRRWLAEHDIPYDRFVSDPGPEKTDVPADVLVDDSPSNVRGFARAGGHGVLFSQPWNEREEYGDGVTVVDGWSEVVRVCEDDTSVGPE